MQNPDNSASSEEGIKTTLNTGSFFYQASSRVVSRENTPLSDLSTQVLTGKSPNPSELVDLAYRFVFDKDLYLLFRSKEDYESLRNLAKQPEFTEEVFWAYMDNRYLLHLKQCANLMNDDEIQALSEDYSTPFDDFFKRFAHKKVLLVQQTRQSNQLG